MFVDGYKLASFSQHDMAEIYLVIPYTFFVKAEIKHYS